MAIKEIRRKMFICVTLDHSVSALVSSIRHGASMPKKANEKFHVVVLAILGLIVSSGLVAIS